MWLTFLSRYSHRRGGYHPPAPARRKSRDLILCVNHGRMISAPTVVALILLIPTIALAQTPSVHTSIGTACQGTANSADFDTIAQCDNAVGGTMKRAPIQVGNVSAPPYANTACNADKAGMIQWNGSDWKLCNGSAWIYLVTEDPCTDPAVTVGTICKDGTAYAGLSPDGSNAKMFTARCNSPYTWTGSGCAGTDMSILWQTGSTGVVTGITNPNTGQANTAALLALGSTAPGPYPAAQACAMSTMHGHSDWYLPASAELLQALAAVGGGGTTYWSSSEADAANARAAGGGFGSTQPKTATQHVRCARKGT